MENTNIVRKIDELGRIVIPKEIRKKLKLRDEDFVEIYVCDDSICLKKHSKIKNLASFAQQLTNMIYSFVNKEILIADKYNIVAYTGNDRKKYLNKETSDELVDSINRRDSIMQNHIKNIKLINNEEIKCSYVLDTIISNSECIGTIIMYSKENILSHQDMQIVKILSSFLSKYLED